MSNIFIKSSTEKQEIEDLLSKKLPDYRKAYSDRTSWLMACISELAYIKFNPIFKDTTKEKFINKAVDIFEKIADVNNLQVLIDSIDYNHEKELKKLEEYANVLELKLIKTFDNDGTQAIVLENDNYIFLGFRGTETTSIKDIRSDLKATLMHCDSGGRVHSGFSEAFDKVYLEIQKFLDQDEFKNKPLFITGHSLGGALATIATKKLTHKGGIASCYTFGSPRIGDEDWILGIKTSIYRIVNAADPITIMPPGRNIIFLISKLLELIIPYFGKKLKDNLMQNFFGYMHLGDMRYLNNCKKGDYENVKLFYSVELLFRIRGYLSSSRGNIFLKNIPADHSMSIYRKKLKVIATSRNK